MKKNRLLKITVDNYIINKIKQTLGNKKLTNNEIILQSKLPITLEGIYPYLKKYFKKKVVQTGRTLRGLRWTNKAMVGIRFQEKITYYYI